MVTLILTYQKLKPTKAGQLSQISPMVSPSRNRSNPDEEEVRRRWKILRPAEIADGAAWDPAAAQPGILCANNGYLIIDRQLLSAATRGNGKGGLDLNKSGPPR